jgi:hypothetical protein
VVAPGRLNAIAFWFDLHLDDQVSISTAPPGFGLGGAQHSARDGAPATRAATRSAGPAAAAVDDVEEPAGRTAPVTCASAAAVSDKSTNEAGAGADDPAGAAGAAPLAHVSAATSTGASGAASHGCGGARGGNAGLAAGSSGNDSGQQPPSARGPAPDHLAGSAADPAAAGAGLKAGAAAGPACSPSEAAHAPAAAQADPDAEEESGSACARAAAAGHTGAAAGESLPAAAHGQPHYWGQALQYLDTSAPVAPGAPRTALLHATWQAGRQRQRSRALR